MQLVAVERENATSSLDVIVTPPVNLEKYCQALIDLIFLIEQSKLSDFVAYQLALVNDPLGWLDCFDLLIVSNERFFIENNLLFKYQKLINLVEKHRDLLQCSVVLKTTKLDIPKRLINAESEERYFSFYETKMNFEAISNFSDKIIFLTEEIFEYRQADIISKNSKLLDYDLQCNQLIERIQTLRKMRAEFENEQPVKRKDYSKPEPMRLNGAINILTHVFKQMMTTVKPNGKPYLQCKIKEVSEFICDNFIDENGHPLSPTTIQTYLSPNRNDKDPNGENIINI